MYRATASPFLSLFLLLAAQQRRMAFVSATPTPVAVDDTSLPDTVVAAYRTQDHPSYDPFSFDLRVLASEIEATYTREGCTGYGRLVSIADAEKNTVVGNVCDSLPIVPLCTIGYQQSPVTGEWGWRDPSAPTSYENWSDGFPVASQGCSFISDGEWFSVDCTSQNTYFLVEYHCPKMDDDWNVAFSNAVATFDDTSMTEPELVVSYNASAPNGSDKFYVQRVMLAPDCVNSTTDGAVAPAVMGMIPDSDYNTSSGILTTKVDIDTDAIEGSSDFWTRISATQGTIDLCVRMDLFNEQNLSMAVETTQITLTVDTTTGFEVTGVNFTNELQTESQEDVQVDYPITAFFCDDNDAEVTPAPTLFPGDVLQVCIKTDSADAFVTDVRSVAFKNSLIAGLVLEVINGDGDETNGQTLKTCDETTGICNIKSVTFSTLYQYDTNNDGVLEDVSAGATMDGTAVLQFGAPSGRRRHRGRNLLVRGQDLDGRRLATVTGFDIDLSRNLEQRPSGLGEDTPSSINNGASAVVGGGIGAGVAVAALAAIVVALVVRRRSQKTQDGGVGEQPTEDPVAVNGGMAMI